MFERPQVDSLDAVACADALAAVVVEQRRASAQRLALAAHWADLHPPMVAEATDPSWSTYRRGAQVRVRPGGSDGTPDVSEFAATELGALLGLTTPSATNLMRDALDLRHRHPRLWAAVMSGQVEDWKARKVAHATATAGLDRDEARWVDAETVDALVGLPFGRAIAVVEAKVIAADPQGEEALRRIEAERQFVSVGRSREHGLRTLIARTTAGNVARLDAMVAHLAELMGAGGDNDPVQVRRARALALLANPAQACLLLGGTDCTSNAEPAAETDDVPPDPADQCLPTAVELGAAFGRVLEGLSKRAWDRLRPRTVLYVHLAEEAVNGVGRTEVARVEGAGPAAGPMTLEDLKSWLRSERVTVRPVLDPTGATPVDSYEIPAHLREALTLLQPYEVFPYGTRATREADLDHTDPYAPPDDGGPPGQTRLDNLGPLGRGHHRAKTFGGFELHQPLPGMYLWRTPTGHWFQVDQRGTHPMSRGTPPILRQLREGPSKLEVAYAMRIETALAA